MFPSYSIPKRIYLDSKPPDSAKVVSGNLSLAEIAAEATAKAEREAIKRALLEAESNREKAAESLGIGRQTLYRKLKLYGME